MTTSINLGSIDNTITPIPPDDNYVITGGDGNNTVTLGNGIDQITLGNGNNTLTLGNGATDQLTLGNGDNTLTIGNGNDTILTGSGNNTITTGNGNSNVTVGNGNDTITVGTGSNTIVLGTGLDTVHTGNGNNTVFVSAGSINGDTMMGALTSLDGSTNQIVVTTAGTGMSPVNVSGFQSFHLANGGANGLTLANGNFARLPLGSISVFGGDSGNALDASGVTVGAVRFIGGAGADVLTGGAGNDTLLGGGGNDILTGGSGNDTLTGGAGADQFHYSAISDGVDHITDFSGHGSGHGHNSAQGDVLTFDHVPFGNLALGVLNSANFVANATGSAHGTAAQFDYNTSTHTLSYDANGTGAGGSSVIAVFDNGFVLNNTDIHIV